MYPLTTRSVLPCLFISTLELYMFFVSYITFSPKLYFHKCIHMDVQSREALAYGFVD